MDDPSGKHAAKLTAKVTGRPYQTCVQVLTGDDPARLGDATVQLDVIEILLAFGEKTAEWAFDLARRLPPSVIPVHVACDPDELTAWMHERTLPAAAAA